MENYKAGKDTREIKRKGKRPPEERTSYQYQREMAGRIKIHKIMLNKARTRHAEIRNYDMFNEDEERFYRNINETKVRKGKVPNIETSADFWAGI